MADQELATRAPESDAQEVSGILGDTKLDQGAASMGVCSWSRDTKNSTDAILGTLHDRSSHA